MILLAGAGAEAIGLHAVFGAFLVGVGVSKGLGPAERQVTHDSIYQLTISVLAPLYFVSIGLKVNFATNFDLALIALIILIASIGKIVGAGLGARLGGMTNKEAFMVGAGMNVVGRHRDDPGIDRLGGRTDRRAHFCRTGRHGPCDIDDERPFDAPARVQWRGASETAATRTKMNQATSTGHSPNRTG